MIVCKCRLPPQTRNKPATIVDMCHVRSVPRTKQLICCNCNFAEFAAKSCPHITRHYRSAIDYGQHVALGADIITHADRRIRTDAMPTLGPKYSNASIGQHKVPSPAPITIAYRWAFISCSNHNKHEPQAFDGFDSPNQPN